MTDSERIDALEREMKLDPFVLHDLYELKGPYRGLSLIGGQRTLREAIDQAFGSPAPVGKDGEAK